MTAALVVLVVAVIGLVFQAGRTRGLLENRVTPATGSARPLALPPPPMWWENPEAFIVPTALFGHFICPQILSDQARNPGDQAKIGELRSTLASEGQREPLELTVGGCGRAVASDGYHRYAALRQLGAPDIAIVIKRSPKITGWGRPISGLFTDPELRVLWERRRIADP